MTNAEYQVIKCIESFQPVGISLPDVIKTLSDRIEELELRRAIDGLVRSSALSFTHLPDLTTLAHVEAEYLKVGKA